jgi:outer membrane protein assembly factor BamB
MVSVQIAGALLIGLLALRPEAEKLRDQFLEAAKRGDRATLEKLLRRGVDANTRSAYGATALHFAADRGHLPLVRVLLGHKANVDAKDSFYTATPLTWAVQKNHYDIVRALLEAGASGADALLISAMQNGEVELLRAILDKGKLKAETLSNAMAIAGDRVALAEPLRKAGAKPLTPAFTLDAATLQACAGKYEGEGLELTLVPQGGMLHVKLGERTLWVVSPLDVAKFKIIGSDAATVTLERQGDKVSGLVYKNSGVSLAFKRSEAHKVVAQAPKTPPVEDGIATVTTPANWPSFRGPHASGVADGQRPPVTWDGEKGSNILWKTPIPGLGHSCPVVWGNRVFITTAISGDPKSALRAGQYGDVDSVNDASIHTWQIFCVDARSGKLLWEQTAHRGVPHVKRHPKGSHANATPATDGQHLVVNFGSEGLDCYDFEGRLLWKRELGMLNSGWFYDADYQWGFASSPVLYRDLVIVQCDVGKGSFLGAYRVTDGSPIWQTAREETSSWGTPTIYEGPPHDQIVTNASKYIRGYEPLTGKELWRLRPNSEITVGTPVCGAGLIFVTGGYPPVRPVYAIRPTAVGDISLPSGKTASEFIAWSNTRNGTYMPTPIVYAGTLVTCNNNGLVTCYEAATGKQLYQERLHGRGGYTASPVAADGRLYFTSEEGGVQVVRAGPKFEVIANNPLGDVCMATPAISNGMLFFRTQHYLIGVGRQVAMKR